MVGVLFLGGNHIFVGKDICAPTLKINAGCILLVDYEEPKIGGLCVTKTLMCDYYLATWQGEYALDLGSKVLMTAELDIVARVKDIIYPHELKA